MIKLIKNYLDLSFSKLQLTHVPVERLVNLIQKVKAKLRQIITMVKFFSIKKVLKITKKFHNLREFIF